MIATVMQTFVDEPKGKEAKRYEVGDIISIAKADFDRIKGQQPEYLAEGKIDLGIGICYPCRKKQK